MQVGYTPDYLFLLQTILRSDPQVCELFCNRIFEEVLFSILGYYN